MAEKKVNYIVAQREGDSKRVFPTLTDMARYYGVSPAAANNVLNNYGTNYIKDVVFNAISKEEYNRAVVDDEFLGSLVIKYDQEAYNRNKAVSRGIKPIIAQQEGDGKRVFPSLKAMAEYYQISFSSVSKALNKFKTNCTQNLVFNTISAEQYQKALTDNDYLNALVISYDKEVYDRKKRGPEQRAMKPAIAQREGDVKRVFSSLKEMAEYYGLSYGSVNSSLNQAKTNYICDVVFNIISMKDYQKAAEDQEFLDSIEIKYQRESYENNKRGPGKKGRKPLVAKKDVDEKRVFPSVKAMAEYYGISEDGVSRALNNSKKNYTGDIIFNAITAEEYEKAIEDQQFRDSLEILYDVEAYQGNKFFLGRKMIDPEAFVGFDVPNDFRALLLERACAGDYDSALYYCQRWKAAKKDHLAIQATGKLDEYCIFLLKKERYEEFLDLLKITVRLVENLVETGEDLRDYPYNPQELADCVITDELKETLKSLYEEDKDFLDYAEFDSILPMYSLVMLEKAYHNIGNEEKSRKLIALWNALTYKLEKDMNDVANRH